MCEVFILAPTDLVDDHELPESGPLSPYELAPLRLTGGVP